MRSIQNRRKLVCLIALFLAFHWITELSGQDTVFSVQGWIYSAQTGQPLQNISISAVNASMEPVNTNSEGFFEIALPDKNEQILVSYPGYMDKKVFVHGRNSLNIWLLGEDDHSMEQPTDMIFREIPWKDIPAAVESIRRGGQYPTSTPSFEQELQGRMSGLMVTNRSGMPGEGAYLSSRGYASLYSTSLPLVVIDGMIQKRGGFDNPVVNGFYHNPLVDLDEKDISSIVLLKDAAATGTYGIKGSNGVLLITTTLPEGGKTTMDVSVSGGLSIAPPQIPVMDGDHFSSYVMGQMYSAGLSSAEIFSEYPFMEFNPSYLYFSRYNNNTNWQNKVFRTGNLSNAHLTVRGGDARATYALSGGYLSHEGIVNNSSYNRFNFRFNSIVQVSSRLDIGFNLGYSAGKSNLMESGTNKQTNPIYASLIKSPILAVYQKDQEGTSLPVFDDVADFDISNPAVVVNKVDASNSSSKFLGVSYVKLKLSDKLSMRAQFGLDRLKANEKIFIPSWGMAQLGDGSADRSMNVKVDQYYSILGETRISYLNRFNYLHDFSVDAGARYMLNRLSQDAGYAQNSATDEFKDLNSGKVDEKSVSGYEDRWSWLNYFVSAGYIFDDRYILRANLSLDASSKFGKEVEEGIKMAGYPFAVLPSLGLAWRISSESFIPDLEMLDELKWRVSYGLTGSDEFPGYYTQLYYATIPYYSITGFTLNGLYNPNLKWEAVKTFNTGLDLAMYHERLILNANWYLSRTEDMITHQELPGYYGYPTYLANSGASENRGMEINLYGRILNGSLRWEADMNFMQYRNKVIALANEQIVTSFNGGEKISKVGSPMGLFYGYQSLGVISSQQEADEINLVDKAGRRFNAGDILFDDLDENGIIDERDKTVIGNPHPDFVAGLYNRISYKGISLGILLQYTGGVDVFNYLRSDLESMDNYDNQTTAVYNRWVADGQETTIPKEEFGDPMGNSRFSSRWIEDGSYFRLKSLTLSYKVPAKLIFVNKLNIYLTGTNLITITKYTGYDPEFSYSDGILGQGIDYGKFPQPRTMIVGIKVGL
ncbi:MAG: SusC/RagA family TonB-linked outer membrane protein [Bacteroidales bacterium]|nr:SusC/RagA family TonB-linked outer membrane protein [Bacteroidales bacterium]